MAFRNKRYDVTRRAKYGQTTVIITTLNLHFILKLKLHMLERKSIIAVLENTAYGSWGMAPRIPLPPPSRF